MGLIESIMAGVLSRFIYDEANTQAPLVERLLLSCALKLLPNSKRGRCAEEWQAWLTETQGTLRRLSVCVGFFIAGVRIRMPDLLTGIAILTHNSMSLERQLLNAFAAGWVSGFLKESGRDHTDVAVINAILDRNYASRATLKNCVRLRWAITFKVMLGSDEEDALFKALELVFSDFELREEILTLGEPSVRIPVCPPN